MRRTGLVLVAGAASVFVLPRIHTERSVGSALISLSATISTVCDGEAHAFNISRNRAASSGSPLGRTAVTFGVAEDRAERRRGLARVQPAEDVELRIDVEQDRRAGLVMVNGVRAAVAVMATDVGCPPSGRRAAR